MAELCERAETLLKEKNIRLSAEKRAILATYDADTQVRWIVNPLVEWILQNFTNQLINGRLQTSVVGDPLSQTSATLSPIAPAINKPQPKVDDKGTRGKSVPKPEPEPPGSDDDDIGLGLFD